MSHGSPGSRPGSTTRGVQCLQRLSHGDIVVLEAVQCSTVYAVQLADAQAGVPALLYLTSSSVERAASQPAVTLEVVQQGEWLGLRSPLLEGLFLQARKKAPNLVFFSARLGVWEQWKADPLYQGVLQQHSPGLCLTSRQVPNISLGVRAWKVGSLSPPPPRPLVVMARPAAQLDTGHGLASDQRFPVDRSSGGAACSTGGAADSTGRAGFYDTSLQDDALELSHNVVKGYVTRVTKWPLFLAFRLWRAETRRSRVARAQAAVVQQRQAVQAAWAAEQQQVAAERHATHMMVLATHCQERHRNRRLVRCVQTWRDAARRAVLLRHLYGVCVRKRVYRRAAAVLAEWSRVAARARSLLRRFRICTRRRAERLARAVLLGWQRATAELRLAMAALALRRDYALLRTALAFWRDATSTANAARQAAFDAACAATAAFAAAILRAWRDVCEQRRQLAARGQLLTASTARRALGTAWSAWRGLTADSAVRRHRAEQLRSARAHRLVGAVMLHWASLASASAALRFAAERLAARREQRLLPRVFEHWRTLARQSARLEEEGSPEATARAMGLLRRMLITGRVQATARRVLSAWRRLAAARWQLRLSAAVVSRLNTRALLRSAVRHWRGVVLRSEHMQQELLALYLASRLRRVLKSWSDLAAANARLSATAELARRRLRRRRLAGVWGAWRGLSRHSQDRCRRAVALHDRRLSLQALQGWRHRCERVRQGQAALSRLRRGYERGLMGAALQALGWRAGQARAVVACKRRRMQELGRRALRAMRAAAVYGAKLRSFARLIGAKWRRSVARGVLRSWFVVSHSAALQVHLLEAIQEACWGGVAMAGSVDPSAPQPPGGAWPPGPAWQAGYLAGAGAMWRPSPPHHPAWVATPLTSADTRQAAVLRVLAGALGGPAAIGPGGGAGGAAAAVWAASELLLARLPALARAATRPKQRVLAAFRAWRALAEARRGREVAAARLVVRRRQALTVAAFGGWWEAVAAVRAARRAAVTHSARVLRAFGRRCLIGWAGAAQIAVRRRRQCVRLLARRADRKRAAVLAAWRAEAAASRARTQEARTMKSDARSSLLRRAMRAWSAALSVAAEARTAAEKRGVLTLARMRRAVMVAWRHEARLSALHTDSCVRLLRGRWDRRLAGLALLAWWGFAQAERRRREDWPQLCRTFYAWLTLVQPWGRAASAAAAKLDELGLPPLPAPQPRSPRRSPSSPTHPPPRADTAPRSPLRPPSQPPQPPQPQPQAQAHHDEPPRSPLRYSSTSLFEETPNSPRLPRPQPQRAPTPRGGGPASGASPAGSSPARQQQQRARAYSSGSAAAGPGGSFRPGRSVTADGAPFGPVPPPSPEVPFGGGLSPGGPRAGSPSRGPPHLRPILVHPSSVEAGGDPSQFYDPVYEGEDVHTDDGTMSPPVEEVFTPSRSARRSRAMMTAKSAYYWQHWHNLMQGSMSGMPGGGAALPLPPWSALAGAVVAAADGGNAELLKERLGKLEEAIKLQRDREEREEKEKEREAKEKEKDKEVVAAAAAAAAAAVTAAVGGAAAAAGVGPGLTPAPSIPRPPPPPPTLGSNSSRILTASCRPEPGPLYQLKQMGRASATSLPGLSPHDSFNSGATAPSPTPSPPPTSPGASLPTPPAADAASTAPAVAIAAAAAAIPAAPAAPTVHVHVVNPYGPPPGALGPKDSRRTTSEPPSGEVDFVWPVGSRSRTADQVVELGGADLERFALLHHPRKSSSGGGAGPGASGGGAGGGPEEAGSGPSFAAWPGKPQPGKPSNLGQRRPGSPEPGPAGRDASSGGGAGPEGAGTGGGRLLPPSSRVQLGPASKKAQIENAWHSLVQEVIAQQHKDSDAKKAEQRASGSASTSGGGAGGSAGGAAPAGTRGSPSRLSAIGQSTAATKSGGDRSGGSDSEAEGGRGRDRGRNGDRDRERQRSAEPPSRRSSSPPSRLPSFSLAGMPQPQPQPQPQPPQPQPPHPSQPQPQAQPQAQPPILSPTPQYAQHPGLDWSAPAGTAFSAQVSGHPSWGVVTGGQLEQLLAQHPSLLPPQHSASGPGQALSPHPGPGPGQAPVIHHQIIDGRSVYIYQAAPGQQQSGQSGQTGLVGQSGQTGLVGQSGQEQHSQPLLQLLPSGALQGSSGLGQQTQGTAQPSVQPVLQPGSQTALAGIASFPGGQPPHPQLQPWLAQSSSLGTPGLPGQSPFAGPTLVFAPGSPQRQLSTHSGPQPAPHSPTSQQQQQPQVQSQVQPPLQGQNTPAGTPVFLVPAPAPGAAPGSPSHQPIVALAPGQGLTVVGSQPGYATAQPQPLAAYVLATNEPHAPSTATSTASGAGAGLAAANPTAASTPYWLAAGTPSPTAPASPPSAHVPTFPPPAAAAAGAFAPATWPAAPASAAPYMAQAAAALAGAAIAAAAAAPPATAAPASAAPASLPTPASPAPSRHGDPLGPVAPDMSELDRLLGQLEAKSRSAMVGSPRRQQLPYAQLQAVGRAATVGGVSGPSAGVAVGRGLFGLDGIDGLHARATTLSAPGAPIFTPSAGAGAGGGGGGGSGRSGAGGVEAQAEDDAAAVRQEMVDQALRKLEAQSVHAQAAAAAWSAVAGEVEAAAAAAGTRASDRDTAVLASAIEAAASAAAAAASASVTEPARMRAAAAAAAAAAAPSRAPSRTAPGGDAAAGAGRAPAPPLVSSSSGVAADLLSTFLAGAEELVRRQAAGARTAVPQALAAGSARNARPRATAAAPVQAQPQPRSPQPQRGWGPEEHEYDGAESLQRPPKRRVPSREGSMADGAWVHGREQAGVYGGVSGGAHEEEFDQDREEDLCPTCGSPTRPPSPARRNPQPDPRRRGGVHTSREEGEDEETNPEYGGYDDGDGYELDLDPGPPRLPRNQIRNQQQQQQRAPSRGGSPQSQRRVRWSADGGGGADAASANPRDGRPQHPTSGPARRAFAPEPAQAQAQGSRPWTRSGGTGAGAVLPEGDALDLLAELAHRRGNSGLAATLAGLSGGGAPPPPATAVPARRQHAETRAGASYGVRRSVDEQLLWEDAHAHVEARYRDDGREARARAPVPASIRQDTAAQARSSLGPQRARPTSAAPARASADATALRYAATANGGHKGFYGRPYDDAPPPPPPPPVLSRRPRSPSASYSSASLPADTALSTPSSGSSSSSSTGSSGGLGTAAAARSVASGGLLGDRNAVNAIRAGFDPDPLTSPLRGVLGQCKRLQANAAVMEAEGEEVARGVVADLSPRSAVAAALRAVARGGGGAGAGATGAGARRVLSLGGRRV
ncbi:hypothetical protein HYH03_013841 [Edaphochlamys debaryana]|uniref:Uncharacterized protein n=1 Tax=Edaphochlamys debaryana TaxID=47281 RepID=A0A835XMG2_9CHLO|nr:hypothetical protein HYH03_013841 [Edaphochlamys debaryana]|eukprot:KAG2487562.1 hypothetical protein HYH03_013841 [Edaphochlamys debaryana]